MLRVQEEDLRRKSLSRACTSTTTCDVHSLTTIASSDKLGAIGVRLRQEDCMKQGWVMNGFPVSMEQAQLLEADGNLRPTRVITLNASVDTCVSRLRHLFVDHVTGKVWHSLPKNPQIRSRLKRSEKDQPAAVTLEYNKYQNAIDGIVHTFASASKYA